MSRKSKGINAERDLIHKFWANGWAAIRVAGSGSTRYPSPDILAGNGVRRLAIECKCTKDNVRYLTKEEIRELIEFSRIFGAETWIAIKFNKTGWYFLSLEDIKETKNNYVITDEIAKNRGLLFEELTG
ncbi:MAG: Holliday junction resolvase [Nanoarchaeota archaeon]|nr:Holliday junction resolvase [Nanoarchaeota archaeon]